MDLVQANYAEGEKEEREPTTKVIEEAKKRLELSVIAPPVSDSLVSQKFTTDLISGHSELDHNPSEFLYFFSPKKKLTNNNKKHSKIFSLQLLDLNIH